MQSPVLETLPDGRVRHRRVDVADVLRGFAVMGIILLHNIEHFNFYSFPDTAGQPAWLNFTDRAIWDGLFFTFGGKAYAIFALLFGFSFFIQDDNQKLKGNDFRARFCWRLCLLFVIGNINAAFFPGDVLVMYAMVGFVLVLTCRLSTRWIIALSAICLLQPIVLHNIVRLIADPSYVVPEIESGAFWNAAFQAQTYGTFADVVRVNLWEGQLASMAWAWDHGRIFQTAGLFMMGMLIGRNGWMLRENLRGWGVALCWAIPAFCILRGLSPMYSEFIGNKALAGQLSALTVSLANMAFMVILCSGVIFVYYRTEVAKLLKLLIPYGRMSLTNYLSQSLIGSFIYYNWGLGGFRFLGITASVGVGVCLFIAQCFFCHWWMKRYSHGPLEGAWKKMTWINLPQALRLQKTS